MAEDNYAKTAMELCPCPKCKSSNVAVSDETLYAYHATCYNCGLDILESYQFRRYGNSKPSYEVKEEQESMERAKKRVIERWNKGDTKSRPPEPMPRYWAY